MQVPDSLEKRQPALQDVLISMARAAERFARVPAVGVSDWGTRAARALVTGERDVVAMVAIVEPTLRPRKAVLWHVCHAGAWVESSGAFAHVSRVDLVGMASRQSIASTHVEEFADAQQPVATEFVRAPDPFDRVGPWGREIAGLTLEFGLRLGARTACVTSIRRAGVWHPADRLAMGVRAAMLGERAARLLHAGEQPNWLTDRETEVLNRLTEGYSESEVADQLGRSRFTIHDHVKNMYRKLHAENRADLVRLAMGGQNEPFRSESAAPADLSVSLIAS